jgi:hypothetical protein
MKMLPNSYLLAIGLLLLVSSCKKSSTATQVLGKWNILSDSMYVGAGTANNKVAIHVNRGDYFNFSSDGHIYMLENSIFDTISYSLSSNFIVVPGFEDEQVTGTGLISYQLNKFVLSISTGYSPTPGGTFGKTVHLTR